MEKNVTVIIKGKERTVNEITIKRGSHDDVIGWEYVTNG